MKVTKAHLKRIIKEEINREYLKALIKEEVQEEGLMDFFTGGGAFKKDWQALVQRLFPRMSDQDLSPEEVAEVLSYGFDSSQMKPGMANEKGLMSLSPKSKLRSPNPTIAGMSPKALNKVLSELEIPNTIYHLMMAKMKNPKLENTIYEKESELETSDRSWKKTMQDREASAQADRTTANRAAGIAYDKRMSAEKDAAQQRAELEKSRREREEEERASTKNSRPSGSSRG